MTPYALLVPALALAGCATIAGTVGESWNAALVGAQEVPGPGAPDGTGTVKVTADSATDTVCYTLAVRGISVPTAAPTHQGALGVAARPVLPLAPPTSGRPTEYLSVADRKSTRLTSSH